MSRKTLLLFILLIIMLFGFARAVPSATITEDAQSEYLEEGTDDEYDFL